MCRKKPIQTACHPVSPLMHARNISQDLRVQDVLYKTNTNSISPVSPLTHARNISHTDATGSSSVGCAVKANTKAEPITTTTTPITNNNKQQQQQQQLTHARNIGHTDAKGTWSHGISSVFARLRKCRSQQQQQQQQQQQPISTAPMARSTESKVFKHGCWKKEH